VIGDVVAVLQLMRMLHAANERCLARDGERKVPLSFFYSPALSTMPHLRREYVHWTATAATTAKSAAKIGGRSSVSSSSSHPSFLEVSS